METSTAKAQERNVKASERVTTSISVVVRALLARGLARFSRVRGERRMELIETLQLGAKRQLMLVSCEGQRYLVGAGGDSIQSIVEVRIQPAALVPPQAKDALVRVEPDPVDVKVQLATGCIQ